MPDSFIPLERHEVKESGRAIQQAQNTVMAAGSAATIALIRELLKSLKLPEKSVSVKIASDDSVAYQANIQDGKSVGVKSETRNFSEQQLRYLQEVVKLPASNEPAAASIPLDKNVTVTVDGQEVFRLKDGIVQKNLLTPTPDKIQENPSQIVGGATQEPEIDKTPVEEAQVEIVGEDIPELKQAGVSLSDGQRQELEKLGVNPQVVENAVGQDVQGKIPIIVVLNREVERKVTKSPLKENLKSMLSPFQKAVRDLSRRVSSFLSSAREKLFPASERAIKQDLQNLAVANVASRLLARLGSKSADGKQVFEGNTFRLERQDNNLTVTAKDGRGTILSLKDGELTGSLVQKDVEKFQAVERQLERGKSRQSQIEMG
jgi:predicted double-glycine peptidase